MDEGRRISFIKTASAKTEKKASKATDKAMQAASKLGKPTTTGLTAGAGLGAIMATLGAISRDGNGNDSALTNPLLLGALGAGTGYLAGNAFDRMPAKGENSHDGLKGLGILGALGGAGTLGSYKARANLIGELQDSEQNLGRVLSSRGIRTSTPAKNISSILDGAGADRVAELGNALKRRVKALRAAGDFVNEQQLSRRFGEHFRGILRDPKDVGKLSTRIKNMLIHAPESPIGMLKSLIRSPKGGWTNILRSTSGRVAAGAGLGGLGLYGAASLYDALKD